MSVAARAVAAVPGLVVHGLVEPQYSDEDVSFTGIETDRGELTVFTSWTSVGATDLARRCSEVDLFSSLPSTALPYAVPSLLGTHTGYDTLTAVFSQTPGVPVEEFEAAEVDWARKLGRAVAAIHALDPAWVASNVPSYSSLQMRERRLAELDAAAETGRIPSVLLERWEKALENVSLWQFSPSVVHGALSPAAFRQSDSQIVALDEFGGLHIGDPAEDVRPFTAGVADSVEDAFLVAYASGLPTGLPSNLAERAGLLSELELARWLMQGLHAGDADTVAEAHSMLQEFADEVSPPAVVAPAALSFLADSDSADVDGVGTELVDDAAADASIEEQSFSGVVFGRDDAADLPAEEWQDGSGWDGQEWDDADEWEAGSRPDGAAS